MTSIAVHDRRRALLTAALAFSRLRIDAPEVRLLCRWLDTWHGIGAIAVGKTGQRLS